jgi:hypothetical protein
MPRTPYRAGYEAEKRVAHRLRADGYLVLESRGSHGAADLVAAKPGQVLLVQVKKGEARLDGQWWNELWRSACIADAVPVVADFLPPPGKVRGVLRLRRILGPHAHRSKYWPCQPFETDEIDRSEPLWPPL